MALTELQTLERVYFHVKEHGKARDHATPQFGGIWSADYWELGEVSSSLQDDGSTQAIITPDLRACSTYGRPVQYFAGTADDLKALCLTYFPESQFDF